MSTLTDSLGPQRRALYHLYHFPIRFGQRYEKESSSLSLIQDGGCALGPSYSVEWPYYGWVVDGVPMIGRATEEFFVEKHLRGRWIAGNGVRYRVYSDAEPKGSVILGSIAGGVIGLRKDGSRKGLFGIPPFCPSLQAALLVGHQANPDSLVENSVKAMPAVSEIALRWLEGQSDEVRECFSVGVERIYSQTQVYLGGAVVTISPETIIEMMEENGFDVGDREETLACLANIRDNHSGILPEIFPMYEEKSIISPLEAHPSIIPKTRVYTKKGVENIEFLSFHSYPTPSVNSFQPFQCIGIQEDSFLARQWYHLVAKTLSEGSIPRVVFGEVKTEIVHSEHRYDRRRNIIKEVRERSGFVPFFESDNPKIQFLNAEAIRLFSLGIVFSDRPWNTFFDSEVSLPATVGRGIRLDYEIPGQPPIMIPTNDSDPPVIFGDPLYKELARKDYGSLLQTTYKEVERNNLGFPGQTVCGFPMRKEVGGGVHLRSSEATYKEEFGDIFAIDPPGCEAKDDAIRITREGDTIVLDAFFVSVAACGIKDTSILEDLQPETEYRLDKVEKMIANTEDFEFREGKATNAHWVRMCLLDIEAVDSPQNVPSDNISSADTKRRGTKKVVEKKKKKKKKKKKGEEERERGQEKKKKKAQRGAEEQRDSYIDQYTSSSGSFENPIVKIYYKGVRTVRLARSMTYDEAWHQRNSSEIRDLIIAGRILREERTGVVSDSILHTEYCPNLGYETAARENIVHNAIGEVSIGIGLLLGQKLPIKVSTENLSLGPRSRRARTQYDKTQDLVDYEYVRFAAITEGGAKRYTMINSPHIHIDLSRSYGHVCSPLRQLDSLINDFALCGAIDSSSPLISGAVSKLNLDIPRQRAQKGEDRIQRLRYPLGIGIIVRVHPGNNVVIAWPYRQAQLELPYSRCMIRGLEFDFAGKRFTEGDHIYFKGSWTNRGIIKEVIYFNRT